MKNRLIDDYIKIRKKTVELCTPLEVEDYVIQGLPDVSPPKWHLGHTTWFFENFILNSFSKDYKFFNEQYNLLFNSYYKSMGHHWLQQQRGLLSRPLVSEVFTYRNVIDEKILNLFHILGEEEIIKCSKVLEVGLHHEQQHQELLLMDIKYNFSLNPLNINYVSNNFPNKAPTSSIENENNWISFDGGLFEMGQKENSFSYDNESPQHKAYLPPFKMSNTLITNGQFLEFMKDGGYQNPEFWLSDGLNFIQQNSIKCPLYWSKELDTNEWSHFTLHGKAPLDKNTPVSHISFYEASAYCEWAGGRLPTEFEWEFSSNGDPHLEEGNFQEEGTFAATGAGSFSAQGPFYDLLGNVWEWTSSYYLPYPGYNRQKGPLGEYNGKFMNNQRVLRGGSFATPKRHIRKTYRNFYYPDKRWAFNGLRMAKDI